MSVALQDVSFRVQDGEFIGVIGHTGSGKSTLIQHLNGLIKPSSGTVVVDGMDLSSKSTSPKGSAPPGGAGVSIPRIPAF